MLNKAISIIVGSLCIAIGINFFVIPYHLLDGGIIGIGLLLNYTYGLKPGLAIILISIPLYTLAFYYNRSYFYNGIHGLLISSLLIDFFHFISLWNTGEIPILINALIAGLLIGIGIGMMLLNEISTGGIDLLALIVSNITKLNPGIFIFIIDCFILLIGWFVVPELIFFYSCIMVLTVDCTTYLFLKLVP
ncbi:YitT family protein [Oceanobacillus chungangensis]|uniref:YitT family protein n=1 Tax=Oceanobacillus chungangensis TaxID=1229152 RepID=A0A3D8PY23_9BACI|nr:YitT family protein [Oceanobacillus chungangensis]RDW20914.1 hypothetical protein CWR45_03435 [Oceanobacillus chungangensis]